MKQSNKSFLFISALVITGSAYAQTNDYGAPVMSSAGGSGSIYNVAVGVNAGSSSMTGSDNTIIGGNAGGSITSGSANTCLGTAAGAGGIIAGVSNTFVGYEAGIDCGNSSNNVNIGYRAGMYAQGANNIFIGYNAGSLGSATSVNNKLFIDISGTASPLIWGDFSLRQAAINGALTVNGATTINGALSATGIINSSNAFTTGPAGNSNYTQVKCDGTNTTIDQMGTTTGGVLLNYLSGKDVNICTNSGAGNGTGLGSNGNGGYVNTGFNVNIGGAWPQNSAVALNIRANGTTAVNIQTPTNATVFNVGSNGLTTINLQTAATNTVDAFVITSSGTNSTNFKVKNTGQVYAREVIVSLANFPDYVFTNNYKLMPLAEVQKYIETNHHLPNMPGAAEVDKEGANLGEIQRVSVEKIEELTLYIIEMKKEIEELKQENKELKASINK